MLLHRTLILVGLLSVTVFSLATAKRKGRKESCESCSSSSGNSECSSDEDSGSSSDSSEDDSGSNSECSSDEDSDSSSSECRSSSSSSSEECCETCQETKVEIVDQTLCEEFSEDLWRARYPDERILSICKQQHGESTEKYIARIFDHTAYDTIEEWMYIMSAVLRLYCHLDMWYDKQYLCHTRYYFERTCSRTPQETTVAWYQRLVEQRSYESRAQVCRRVCLMQHMYPNIDLWSSKKHFELVQPCYSEIYGQRKEESEECYFHRLFERNEGEKHSWYCKRILNIKRCHPSLSLWYNVNYISYIQPIYIYKYHQSGTETEEQFVCRLVEKCKNNWKLMHILYYCYPDMFLEERYFDYFKLYFENLCKGPDESYSDLLIRYVTMYHTETIEHVCQKLIYLKRIFSSYTCWNRDTLDSIKDHISASHYECLSESEVFRCGCSSHNVTVRRG